jgi:hypothetical protein
LRPRRLRRLLQQVVANAQHVEVRSHERLVGFARCADDRIPAQIEARVDEHRTAGAPEEGFEHAAIGGVAHRIDGLDARRLIDVRDRRHDRASHLELVQALRRASLRQALLRVHGSHEQHVGTFLAHLRVEPLVDMFFQDRRREGPEAFAELHLVIDGRLHRRLAWIGENAARAESARPELHAALEPAGHEARVESGSDTRRQRFVVVDAFVVGPDGVQLATDGEIVEARPEQRPLHAVAPVERARLLEQLMADEERDAERATRVTGRRLHPDLVERTVAEQAPVGDAVERHTARHAQPPLARARLQAAGTAQHDVFG